jgi:hypothetical protein
VAYRCSGCGRDFYTDEPQRGTGADLLSGNGLIDDEQALRAAEEELKKQIEEEDDRRFK